MAHALACPVPIGGIGCAPLGFLSPTSLGTSIASALLSVAATWVTTAATWLLSVVGVLLTRSTEPPVTAGWFAARQQALFAATAPIALLALVAGVLHGLLRGGLSELARTVLLRLPVAILLGAAAAGLVGLAVSATDGLSASFVAGSGASLTGSLHELALAVETTGFVPGAIAILVAGLVAFGALALWIELVVRAAAITVATVLLPIVLATTLWPPAVAWARRLAETLGALIVSKAVVVLVLSIALDAVAQATDGPAAGLTGAALLLLAAFSPFALLRLVPAVEGAAVGHLEAVRHRATAAARTASGRAVSLALAGAPGGAAPWVDPVGSNPIGLMEGVEVDLLKGSALDPDLTFVKGPPPVVAVPASKGRHVWERDRIGPRLVWKPPWDDDGLGDGV